MVDGKTETAAIVMGLTEVRRGTLRQILKLLKIDEADFLNALR